MARSSTVCRKIPTVNSAEPALTVLAWGNESRGDDGAGPIIARRIKALDRRGIEVIEDLQLHIEHVMDLESDVPVLFVDASVAIDTGFSIERIGPIEDNSYSTHTVSPHALLHLFEKTRKKTAPDAWLLHICGRSFELGDAVSEATAQYVEDAWRFLFSELLAEEIPLVPGWPGNVLGDGIAYPHVGSRKPDSGGPVDRA